MRLLLVHGRSQGGLDEKVLAADWRKVLDLGVTEAGIALPGGLTVDFPYYGDVLDQFVADFDLSADDVATAKGVGAGDEFAEFASEIALEAQEIKQIPDERVERELEKFHGRQAAQQKGPENWEWVQSIISLLDDWAPYATEKTFSLFLRDVFLYTRRDAVRDAIDQIVLSKLTDEPTVVVGHSLGSVVAYNVLQSANKATVPAFVTLGSPLGIRGISSSLVKPWRNVSGVHGWLNAYDTRDVVALNPLDARWFGVTPRIKNETVKNTTENHHGISSYLDKAVVAKAVVKGWT